MVCGSWSVAWGLRFQIRGSGFEVQGSVVFGVRVSGSVFGFQVSAQGLWVKDWGSGFGFSISGVGFRV